MANYSAHTFIDNFNRAQVFSTTPGHNGWTIKDTSSSGSPTYLCATDDGGSAVLTLAATNEEEIVTLYQNNVLPYDVRMISQAWWVAKVSGVDSVTTLVAGLGAAQDDTEDNVTVNAWFRMQGSASTSNLLAETDDATTDSDDKSTGTTLASTYKKLLLDFSQGISNVRFFVDGALVRTLSMASLAAGQNVQPFIQLHKASGTGTPAVTVAQFGITYQKSY